jgi:hypothetical protein
MENQKMDEFTEVQVGKLYYHYKDQSGTMVTSINCQPLSDSEQIIVIQNFASAPKAMDCIILDKSMIEDLIDMLMAAKKLCHE